MARVSEKTISRMKEGDKLTHHDGNLTVHKGKRTTTFFFRGQISGSKDPIKEKLGNWSSSGAGLSLKQAEALADEWRALCRDGKDPRLHSQLINAKADQNYTFRAMAQEFIEATAGSVGPKTTQRRKRHLNIDCVPIHNEHVDNLKTATALMPIVDSLKGDGAKPLSTCLTLISQTLDYARREYRKGPDVDITALLKRDQTARYAHVQTKHARHARVADLPKIASVMNSATSAWMSPLCLGFRMHTMVRGIEILRGRWEQVSLDTDHPEWRIPGALMKNKREHIVPLTPEAIGYLLEYNKRCGGSQQGLLFPGEKIGEPISDSSVREFINRYGLRNLIQPHGTRSSASTALHDMVREDGSPMFSSEWIEAQLSHVDRNEIRASYNHTLYLEQRRRMLKLWSAVLAEAGFTVEQYLTGVGADNSEHASDELREALIALVVDRPGVRSDAYPKLLRDQGVHTNKPTVLGLLQRLDLDTPQKRKAFKPAA